MITLDDVDASEEVIVDLARSFEFNRRRAGRDTSWINVSPDFGFESIAGDGMGGVFLAYGAGPVELRPILYATSEGQASRLADNLTAMLAMFMGCVDWPALLKFSGGGELVQMRRTADVLRRENGKWYKENLAARDRIQAALAIPVLDDPIAALHDAVHATDCTLVADDGWRYESLFNRFVVEDNRNWRESGLC